MNKTYDDLAELKAQWLEDPIGDLYSGLTEGFEEYRELLYLFQEASEECWRIRSLIKRLDQQIDAIKKETEIDELIATRELVNNQLNHFFHSAFSESDSVDSRIRKRLLIDY